jgi:hypothetical protein
MIQLEADGKIQDVEIRAGDVFATKNPMWLGRIINMIQRFWSRDGRSKYSHGGIIVNEHGETFEALWRIGRSTLFKYAGEEIIIARCVTVSAKDIDFALKRLIVQHTGHFYPLWRLPMHLFPPLAKISIIKRPVCSELVAKYEHLLGIRHGQWAGTNPDTLSDEWIRWRWFEVLGEGNLIKGG